jgi:four helix bundle protein
MNSEELKSRTKKLAIDIIHFVETLPRTDSARIIGKQLIRSATSVAANYRAACRARSKADFVNKIGIVEEEADETLFWIEILIESGKAEGESVAVLQKEVDEIAAIFAASHKTAKMNRSNASRQITKSSPHQITKSIN